MKINIVSTNHISNKKYYFNFKLSDLAYLGDRIWDNKVFKCWYKTKYINVILWKRSSFKDISDEGHGRSINNDIIFENGEFLTFTYDDTDYSEWESTINKKMEKYKNIHQDKICVLLGSGPSLKKYKKIDNAIHFGVNHINKLVDYDIDYYFLNDWGGVKKDSSVLNFKVNKMRFFSHYKKKSNFIKYGEGIYPKFKKELDDSKFPYEYIECVPKRDARIKDFKWFKHLDKYGLGSSINSMLRILQISLFMGFKHIILVGCDCTEKYTIVLDLWKESFKQVNKLYPNVNIFIYNPVNLTLKPTFNLLNLMILKRKEDKYFLNKYLFNLLFKNNPWKSFTYDNLIFKPYNKELVYFESEKEINTNIIYLTQKSILKYLFNFNLNNVSELIVNDITKSIFGKKNIIMDKKLYKSSKINKLLLINEPKIVHENIIGILINYNENTLIIQNNYKTQTIILGKIIYFLNYYKLPINNKNIIDILILTLRIRILFNIVTSTNICCEELIDKKFFFLRKEINFDKPKKLNQVIKEKVEKE